jgi:hypothetical protein
MPLLVRWLRRECRSIRTESNVFSLCHEQLLRPYLDVFVLMSERSPSECHRTSRLPGGAFSLPRFLAEKVLLMSSQDTDTLPRLSEHDDIPEVCILFRGLVPQ